MPEDNVDTISELENELESLNEEDFLSNSLEKTDEDLSLDDFFQGGLKEDNAESTPDQNIFTVAPRVILAATSVIKPSATVMNIIATVGGGAVTLTSNPSIEDGINGQLLVLRGSSATDTITLTDGNGMLLAGTVTLGLNDILVLYYDGLVTKDWIEVSRTLNTVQTYTVTNPTTDRAFDANEAAGTISNPPTQAEVENIRDAVLELADVVGTLIVDLRTWGIIK